MSSGEEAQVAIDKFNLQVSCSDFEVLLYFCNSIITGFISYLFIYFLNVVVYSFLFLCYGGGLL